MLTHSVYEVDGVSRFQWCMYSDFVTETLERCYGDYICEGTVSNATHVCE